MASLIDLVANSALKSRFPLAAPCLSRMASAMARLVSGLAGLGNVGVFRFVVIDVEAEDVPVLDRVGDGVGMEFFLEQVFRGSQGGRFGFDLSDRRVVFEKSGVPVKPNSWELGKNSLMALWFLAELRSVALVEDEDHSLVAQVFETLLES